MAPKRAPMEDPPSASSSSEDESEETSDKEDDHPQEQSKENPESEEEESSEDEEDDDEENKKPSSVQKPNPTETPQPQSDSDSEGSDSETLPSPTASDFTVKPILSKPMAESTNKLTLKAPNSGAKHPEESEKRWKESQRKKVNGDAEEKKNPIARLWSEEDEIVVLKGMSDYQSKKGADPNTDMGAFHEFIKKSLRVDVSRNQLMDKVRRLKKKYRNNAGKGEKGEDPVFSKPHEYKSFELSKKIWGEGANNAVDGSAKSPRSANKKARKSVKVGNTVLLPKKDGKEVALDEGLKGEVNDMMVDEVKDMKVDEEVFWSMYPRLKESMELEGSAYLTMSVPGKSFLKERMSMIGSAKAKELEEKWRNLREEEVSLYLKRVDLIKEQAKAVLDSMKTSKS
ncbi:STOREKEEPER protein-like [Actinidia eriantha]|uniref:STOREKEEPER protein-like n=1 Tax=Actinidia eriantha TaxID=165200 RepID=UPI0025843C77|nr:STOREKEEPER protein-like [Actinidia eriantha]